MAGRKNTPGVSVWLDSGKTQDVLSKLGKIDAETAPTTLKALMAASTTVVNKAKRKVRKRTGTLSRSIHMEPESDISVVVGTDATYARYQEEGTSKMKGQPYLRPALAESEKLVQKRVAVAMQQMMQSNAG